MKLKDYPALLGEGILMSYAQIFFSKSKLFAVVLLVSTFINSNAGLSGILAIVIAQAVALWFRFNVTYIRDGAYTYNALMTGLVMGYYYEMNLSFFVILALISVFTLFLTIWLANLTAKQALPFLSLPFLFAVWVLLLSAGSFDSLKVIHYSEHSFYDIIFLGESLSQSLEQFINRLDVPFVLAVYLKSLGAIMFQYDLIAGILIAVGLLIYSRMAFLLSILGFAAGTIFYVLLEGNLDDVIYSYIGFNFILSAIAIGGFFLVPSRKSYLLVLVTVPIIAILTSALGTIFNDILHLPLYSLPFNIIVLLVLLILRLRVKADDLDVVIYQQFSPEKNHYKHYLSKARFGFDPGIHISLPFFGKWFVSQGHDGGITHKDDWKDALDFVIVDGQKSTYRQPGTSLADYYCYDKPVTAPGDGYVVEILDGIEDNLVGDVNLISNWGNTIIIKHTDLLYSKLSHIKEGTFKHKIGDYVRKGEVIGQCGSSGRSPEPHLHFQLQATPFIGSKTLDFPVDYFLEQNEHGFEFNSFSVPNEGSTISNVETTKLLKSAFNFIPGKTFDFTFSYNQDKPVMDKWEVMTTAYNQSYIYCHRTKSIAYFVNNGTLFYFTDYEGDTNAPLYFFYIGAQRILMGFYKNLELDDQLLTIAFFHPLLHSLQDFIAPFYKFLKADYKVRFDSVDNDHAPSRIEMSSEANAFFMGKLKKTYKFSFVIEENRISKFRINTGKDDILATAM